ncbi:UNKNOWN [Stylonychia lemnae]|uniref:Uncharacterized protein n=1 Tax=Stylonychia lemnae TaxID=5949 RepID=A0A078AJY5_STYLE|nr:UNKNOWN [Stylonychia lemnae]|eukprot:CDW82206.1 UNKNOWN [Stylonychia lemnae]
MKVSKQIFELSEKILDTFDPIRLKAKEIKVIEDQQKHIQERLDKDLQDKQNQKQQRAAQNEQKEKSEKQCQQDDQQNQTEINIQKNEVTKDVFNYTKWDLLDQQLNLEEKRQETEDKDFSKETMLKEMMGCSRDHSKEIDIYYKSYGEKIERIKAMKDEGNKSYKENELEKASYYYAQALLIFYYLVPDNDQEEQESNELKRLCHMNQSLAFLKLKRFKEALSEISQALKIKAGDVKSLLRKTQILIESTEFEEAKNLAKSVLEIEQDNQQALTYLNEIKIKKAEYLEKSKELCQKMVQKEANIDDLKNEVIQDKDVLEQESNQVENQIEASQITIANESDNN